MQPWHDVVVGPPIEQRQRQQLLLHSATEEPLVVLVVVVHQVCKDVVVGRGSRESDIRVAAGLKQVPQPVSVLPHHSVHPLVVIILGQEPGCSRKRLAEETPNVGLGVVQQQHTVCEQRIHESGGDGNHPVAKPAVGDPHHEPAITEILPGIGAVLAEVHSFRRTPLMTNLILPEFGNQVGRWEVGTGFPNQALL